jgi:uncharacterized protein YjbI with pentapeptide repeats
VSLLEKRVNISSSGNFYAIYTSNIDLQDALIFITDGWFIASGFSFTYGKVGNNKNIFCMLSNGLLSFTNCSFSPGSIISENTPNGSYIVMVDGKLELTSVTFINITIESCVSIIHTSSGFISLNKCEIQNVSQSQNSNLVMTPVFLYSSSKVVNLTTVDCNFTRINGEYSEKGGIFYISSSESKSYNSLNLQSYPLNSSSVIISGCSFKNSSFGKNRTIGGVFFIEGINEVKVNDCVVSDIEADTGSFMYICATIASFDMVRISNCSSLKFGAVLCNSSHSLISFTDCIFENLTTTTTNYSKTNISNIDVYQTSGALFVYSSVVIIESCIFSNCSSTAGGSGALGVFGLSPSFFKLVNFTDIETSGEGGAIHAYSDVIIESCYFLRCETKQIDIEIKDYIVAGGGIYCKGNIHIMNSSFYSCKTLMLNNSGDDNKLQGSGGVIFCLGNVSLLNVTFVYSKAEGKLSCGGSIYVGRNITARQLLIRNSTAVNGGGIFVSGLCTCFAFYFAEFDECNASNCGGAVHISVVDSSIDLSKVIRVFYNVYFLSNRALALLGGGCIYDDNIGAGDYYTNTTFLERFCLIYCVWCVYLNFIVVILDHLNQVIFMLMEELRKKIYYLRVEEDVNI